MNKKLSQYYGWQILRDIIWQDKVISFYDPSGELPLDPGIHDRYIAENTANGWIENYIYEWDGEEWFSITPKYGTTLLNRDDEKYYYFNGSIWEYFDSYINHNLLYNYDVNEHIDHSSVSINAGDGLVGGGDLTGNRILDLRLDISDNGTSITGVYGINFNSNLNVTDNVNNTVIIDVPDDLTVMSNYDTDDLTEGTGNLYFTTGRIDSHLTGGTGISYSTGTITNTDTGSDAVSSHESVYNHSNYDTAYDRSVTAVSGDGNSTLTITRQGTNLTADLTHTHTNSEITDFNSGIDGHLSGGTGISYSTGTISLDIASSSALGGIKVGSNLSIEGDGTLNAVLESGAGDNYAILNTDWGTDGSIYSYTINHGMGITFPNVTCWNIDTNKAISPYDIESIDTNNIKIYTDDNSININVRIG